MAIAVPDASDKFTCAAAPNQTSALINPLPYIGNDTLAPLLGSPNLLVINEDCSLDWNTTGGVVGDLYAIQVKRL